MLPSDAENKNPSSIKIRKGFLYIIICFVWFLIIIFTLHIVYGQVEDNFDTYNDGDLNTQGSWSGNTNFDIQGTTIQAGLKAVQVQIEGSVNIAKSFTNTADGIQCGYIRSNIDSGTNGGCFDLQTDTTYHISVCVRDSNTFQYYNGSGWMTIDSITQNTWFKFCVEWRNSDDQARYNVDDGVYTAWDDTYGGAWDYLNKVLLRQPSGEALNVFYDELTIGISEEPPPAEEESSGSYSEIEIFDLNINIAIAFGFILFLSAFVIFLKV